ncbi:hypothetical protein PUMCH_004750 [Australozyma saopauloensis]|uniref:GATA-type domain-containing protein n=1 Tax=Australozyma saopauloensis TaxID=291208 RepID=A0AAX4HGC3_9ASCO|nr:hypothetical protein PUMCH_004750 [[Candida] saopauloensis]
MNPSPENRASVSAKATAELDSGPTIHELFTQAKKLLTLQNRVENRRIRKDNLKSQSTKEYPQMAHQQRTPSTSTSTTTTTTTTSQPPLRGVLDLLLPLSVDDLRGLVSTSLTVEKVSNNPKKFAPPCEVTPMSIEDSPSARSDSSLRDSTATAHTTPQNSVYVKKEPQNGVYVKKEPSSNVSMGELTPTFEEKNTSVGPKSSTAPMPQLPFSQSSIRKSNLTSSLRNQPQKPQPSPIDPKASRSSLSEKSAPGTASTVGSNNVKVTECNNCHTLKTPLWRKDSAGNTLCNACGLFLKLHGSTRPLSLKTDVIRKRSSRRTSQVNKGQGGQAAVPASSSIPNNKFYRNGSLPDYTKFDPDFSINSSYQGKMGSIAASPHGFYSPANSHAHSFDASVPKPKNVLILPKPSGAGSGPNSAVSTPVINVPAGLVHSYNQMSTPSSPYSTSASLQFKRKKSELNMELLDLYNRRHPSVAAMSNSYTNVANASASSIKRVYSMASMNHMYPNLNHRNSVTNMSRTPMPCLTCYTPNHGSLGKPHITPLASFTQTNLYFEAQPESFGRKRSFISQMEGFGPGDTPSSLSSPPFYGDSGAHLEHGIAPNEIEKFDTAGYNEIAGNNLFSNGGALLSPKHQGDIDTDDFFKNYTSLHNEMLGDEITPDLPQSMAMGEMGEKHTIKAAHTQSTLTRGLQGQGINFSNSCTTSGGGASAADLDWLKFEI